MHLKSSADEGLNSLIEDAENIVALQLPVAAAGPVRGSE